MNYKPRWGRIFFLAVIFNFVIIFLLTPNWFSYDVEKAPDDLIEIEWVEVPAVEEIQTVQTESKVQPFPEINLPPLEIPKVELPPLPEPVAIEKPVETPKESPPPTENSTPIEKPADNPENKLKAIVKVYPKDLIDQLVASGAIKEKISLNDEKIILSITIAVDGKVKNAEIISGVQNDERGKIINFVSQIAASSWIFEPYLDENGTPIELKTQIEFKAEDF